VLAILSAALFADCSIHSDTTHTHAHTRSSPAHSPSPFTPHPSAPNTHAGPLTSRAVSRAATLPTDNLCDLICERELSARNPLDLVLEHGGRVGELQGPRSLAHFDRYMYEAAKHMAPVAAGALLVFVFWGRGVLGCWWGRFDGGLGHCVVCSVSVG